MALRTLRNDVAAAVRKQIACGIDVVNDGELGKTNFTNYVLERVSGFEHREKMPGEHRLAHSISARDETEFAEYFKQVGGGFRNRSPRLNLVCNDELRYFGHAALAEDSGQFSGRARRRRGRRCASQLQHARNDLALADQ